MIKLKANPSLIHQLTDHSTEVQKLLRLPMQVIEVKQADIAQSHALRQVHGLFVNDSINLACGQRHGLNGIVTRDADFGRVPGVNLWEPTDV